MYVINPQRWLSFIHRCLFWIGSLGKIVASQSLSPNIEYLIPDTAIGAGERKCHKPKSLEKNHPLRWLSLIHRCLFWTDPMPMMSPALLMGPGRGEMS
jgi:hypothetical protein